MRLGWALTARRGGPAAGVPGGALVAGPTLSWALAHQGMLEDQQRIGAANLVSLMGAPTSLWPLPAWVRWLGLVAPASDRADGILAWWKHRAQYDYASRRHAGRAGAARLASPA